MLVPGRVSWSLDGPTLNPHASEAPRYRGMMKRFEGRSKEPRNPTKKHYRQYPLSPAEKYFLDKLEK
jgi:hypothetical protein